MHSRGTVTGLAILAVLAAFLVYPVGFVLQAAFRDDQGWTLFYLGQVIVHPYLWGCLVNSLALALVVTVLSTAAVLAPAFWFARYDFGGKGLLSGLLLVPMILPPFVGAIGLSQWLARYGSVNLLLMDLGLIREPIDWLRGGGFWSVAVMEVLHLYPVMFLNVTAALANIDPSMDEAARNLGGSAWFRFRKITFPLMRPGYFAGASIVFIWAFTDLGTPLVFGYRRVVAWEIFDRISDVDTNPVGYALVVVTLAISAAGFYLTRGLVKPGRYVSTTKQALGVALPRPGRARHVAIVAYTAALSLAALLPHAGVVLTSLAERWFMTVLPGQWTGRYYELALTHTLAGTSIRNSLLYSSLSTVVDLGLGVAIAYLTVRCRTRLAGVLDGLCMLPLAVPGLVLAFGYLGCFAPVVRLGETAGLPWLSGLLDFRTNPTFLLVAAYAVRRLPYTVRAITAGFQQTSRTLEEAAENLGAGRLRTLRTVTLPLVKANLVAGGILAFAFAMLEVSDSLILAQSQPYFPITKAIYYLLGRPDDGPYVASAMGVLGMVLLGGSLWLAGRSLGRRLGEMFRVG